jgi:hypothetical protein
MDGIDCIVLASLCLYTPEERRMRTLAGTSSSSSSDELLRGVTSQETVQRVGERPWALAKRTGLTP